jgi:hypothetical protein
MADAQAPSGEPSARPAEAAPTERSPAVPERPRLLAGQFALSAETRELLEFVRKENEANRRYFTELVRIFGGGITALVLVAGGLLVFFGLRTFRDIQSQAQEATQTEITNMKGQIQNELTQQFSAPVMKKLIHDTAKSAVQTAVTSQVTADLSSIRTEADATRSDVDKYAMPRVLSSKQRAALKSYLSGKTPFGFIFVRYAFHDVEAASYAEQLAEAFRAGGWQAGAAADFVQRLTPPSFPGVGIWEDEPATYSRTPTQTQNLLTLGKALDAAQITGFQSGNVATAYQLYIYVGPRPLELPTKRP